MQLVLGACEAVSRRAGKRRAAGLLRRMNMMGLLLATGAHRVDPSALPELMAARDRDLLPPPAPAHGLTLESVYYADGWQGRYSHPLHGRKPICEGIDDCEVPYD